VPWPWCPTFPANTLAQVEEVKSRHSQQRAADERWAELDMNMLLADMDMFFVMQQLQRDAQIETGLAVLNDLLKRSR
jgi:hypothetical protein